MDFITKLVKKHSSREDEEHKHHPLAVKQNKSQDMQFAMNKVNLNSVYNKDEDYKPMSTINKGITSNVDYYGRNVAKFKKMIEEDQIIDVEALKKLAWQGIPLEYKSVVWKILLKYIPLNKESRESTVSRKRQEYANFVEMYYTNMGTNQLDDHERKTFEVIKKDVYRTQPDSPLFQQKIVQEMLIRILWIWNIRHPASGYVQGINDLTTPFIAAFILEYLPELNLDSFAVSPDTVAKTLTPENVAKLEADIYFCLSKILDGILDNYTFSQSGTQKTLNKIKDITKKIDIELFQHFEEHQIDFSYFSFRWIFCLLIREFPLKVGLRLFDTYIADEQGFSVFHLYVCAAILLKWSLKIKKMNFTEMMLFLQNMPTKDWREEDIEMIISEAFVFKSLYEDTHGHFDKN